MASLRSKFCIPLFAICLSLAGPAAAQTGVAAPLSQTDAPIAYLYDATSGQVLFEREADRRFMPASITKAMTTFLAFEWMEEGRITPQQSFAMTPDLWRKWSNVGSTMFLPHNARVSVDDLLHGVTTVSANDGAALLAQGAAGTIDEWVTAMNDKAAEIGMADSRFGTPNGWMDEGRTFTTARDLGRLATKMVQRHPSKYRHFIGQASFTYNDITQPNHDPISGVVPGADGIKTGYTNQAGFGFLGSASRNGRRLVMVIAGSDRTSTRNKAARDLIEWGYAAFDQKRLFAPEVPIGFAKVQGGAATQVAMVTPRGLYAAFPTGRPRDIDMSVSYEGPLRAPVLKGAEIGALTVKVQGMPAYTVPLVARDGVPEAGSLRQALNGLLGWFS